MNDNRPSQKLIEAAAFHGFPFEFYGPKTKAIFSKYTDKTEMIVRETMLIIYFVFLCAGIGAFAAGLWTGNTDAYVAAAVAWSYPSILKTVSMIIEIYENHNDN
jgi:hypothetical protein